MMKTKTMIAMVLMFCFSHIQAQLITITSPNGGESWQNSNFYGMTWSDNIPGPVKIELYKADVFYSTIIDSTPSDAYHLWVPNVQETGSDYKVKITSLASSNDFDFSDADFTITKSAINITSPNGGESLQNSIFYGMTWSDNIPGPVKIELYKADVFYSTIIDSTPSDAYHLWVPNVQETGSDYKVKITSLASSNDFDFSNADFTITKSAINITSPNGGESLQNSNFYGMTWSDNIPGPVKIELYKADVFYSTIIDSTPSDAYHLWVPNVQETGSDYKVKITSLASSNDFDFSDADFTITKSAINITSPNGGESLQNSNFYGMTWSDNIPGPVKIELYKADVFYSTIIDSTPSDAYHLWVPNVQETGSDYKVKITSLASSNDFDFSNADITITKSAINITYPNGDDVFQTGNDVGIVWNDNIPGPVKIELYKADVFYSTIIDSTESDWFYLWNITNNFPSGNDYKLKITSLLSSNDYDFCDTTFTIDNPNAIGDESNQLPDKFELSQNYPNPFNPVTSIVFALPVASPVKIILYNLIGEQVDVLFNGFKNAGYHKLDLDASSLNSGVFFYRLEAGEYNTTKKMVLLK